MYNENTFTVFKKDKFRETGERIKECDNKIAKKFLADVQYSENINLLISNAQNVLLFLLISKE